MEQHSRRVQELTSGLPRPYVIAGVVAGLIAAALGTTGCALEPTVSAEGKAPKGTEIVTFTLPHKGTLTTSLPYAVAQARGYFTQHGVAARPVYTEGGGSTVQTVIAGRIDVGMETGPAAVFSAYEHGAPVKIVAATTTGLDVLFFAKGNGPIRTMRDLSGKKVGFSEVGSSSAVGVDQVNAKLKAMGLKPAVGEPIGSPPDQLTAVQTGQIAAGFTAAPAMFDQIAAGKLRVVAQPKDFTSYRNVVARVAFVSDTYAGAHAKQLRGFLDAWHEAWQWSFKHPTQALRIYNRAFHSGENMATLRRALDLYHPSQLRLAPITGLRQTAADALRYKLIDKPLSNQDFDKLVDTSDAPTGP